MNKEDDGRARRQSKFRGKKRPKSVWITNKEKKQNEVMVESNESKTSS